MANDSLLKNTKKEKNNWPGLFPWIGEIFSDSVGLTVQGLWAIIVWLFGPQNRQETSGNDGLYLKATIISVCLSLFLAGISFYGSFAAASSYAVAHGITEGVADWIPIAIDGFVLLGVLVVFGASLVGERVGWVRFLIFVFAMISVIFNVAHILEANAEKAQSAEFVLQPQHILLGAIFPLIVFLASEVTSKQISAYIERKSSLMTNQTLTREIEARIKEKQELIQEIANKSRNRAELEELESRHDILAADVNRLRQESDSLKAEYESARQLIDNVSDKRGEAAKLSNHLASLRAEIEKSESRLNELSQQEGEVFTVNHLKTAYLLGKNPDLKGRHIKDALDVSVAWGNRLKREVKPALNGEGDHD